MAKLKIKVVNKPERCEICHKADQFDPDKNYCSRCDGITTLVAQGRQRPRIYSSSEIEVTEQGESLILTKGNFSQRSFWPALFLWLMFFNNLRNSGRFFLSIFLLYTFFSLISAVNRSIIIVRNGEIRVKQGPIPWFGNCSLNITEIDQIFSERNERRNGKILDYQVCAELRNGRRIKLLGGIRNEDSAIFIEQQIESKLGIIDKPVYGEIPR